MFSPLLPARVGFSICVAPACVVSGMYLMRNDSLPGARTSYSVYGSCVNSRVTGDEGLSHPSGLVCCAPIHGDAATMATTIASGRHR